MAGFDWDECNSIYVLFNKDDRYELLGMVREFNKILREAKNSIDTLSYNIFKMEELKGNLDRIIQQNVVDSDNNNN